MQGGHFIFLVKEQVKTGQGSECFETLSQAGRNCLTLVEAKGFQLDSRPPLIPVLGTGAGRLRSASQEQVPSNLSQKGNENIPCQKKRRKIKKPRKKKEVTGPRKEGTHSREVKKIPGAKACKQSVRVTGLKNSHSLLE